MLVSLAYAVISVFLFGLSRYPLVDATPEPLASPEPSAMGTPAE